MLVATKTSHLIVYVARTITKLGKCTCSVHPECLCICVHKVQERNTSDTVGARGHLRECSTQRSHSIVFTFAPSFSGYLSVRRT